MCQHCSDLNPRTSEKIVKQLPSEKVLENYGRSSKLLLAAKDIPDLQFDAAEPDEEGEASERTEVMEIIDVERKRNMTVSQNSDFREHSKNSLESAAGEAQENHENLIYSCLSLCIYLYLSICHCLCLDLSLSDLV